MKTITKHIANDGSEHDDSAVTGHGVEEEISWREYPPSTLAQIDERLAELGYRREQTPLIFFSARIMTGGFAGESYPAASCGIVEVNTGIAFCNVDARKDDNFKALQALRASGECYAIVNGSIFDL